MKITHLIALSLISVFLVSCASTSATKSHFREFSGPSIKQLGIKKIRPSEVIVKQIPTSVTKQRSGMAKWLSTLKGKKLVQLGSSQYTREGQTDIVEIRNVAASLGAKVVYVDMRYLGNGKKTVAVPVAFTPGRTIRSSSNTYGTVNTRSSSYGSIGSTPYYGRSYGSGNYSGTTNNSTYIPSSTTYAPRQVSYAAYGVTAIFCAPESALSESGLARLQQHRAERKNY